MTPQSVVMELSVLNFCSKDEDGLVIMDVVAEGSDTLLPGLGTVKDRSMELALAKVELVPLVTPCIEVGLVVLVDSAQGVVTDPLGIP